MADTIDTGVLRGPWRTVRGVTTADTLFRPAIGSKCLALYHDGAHAAYWTSVTVRSETPWDVTYSAYRMIHDDGTTGPLVERTSTVTREWTELPPDDATPIAVLWSHHAIKSERGADTQTPWTNNADEEDVGEIAWMLWSEWEVFLRGPRVVHALVTAEQLHDVWKNCDVGGQVFEYMAAFVNQRVTAPVVTAAMVTTARESVSYAHKFAVEEDGIIAACLTAVLASGVAP